MSKLFEIRDKKNISRKQLSEKASVTQNTIRRIEQGKDTFTDSLKRTLASALGCKPEDFDEGTRTLALMPYDKIYKNTVDSGNTMD